MTNFQRLQRTQMLPISEQDIANRIRIFGETREAAIAAMQEDERLYECWANDTYHVQVDRGAEAVHVTISRHDSGPVLRDWNTFQQIKNQIVGEECEAVELYPAESRLVDLSNKYHLWAFANPKFRFPFGFNPNAAEYRRLKANAALGDRSSSLT